MPAQLVLPISAGIPAAPQHQSQGSLSGTESRIYWMWQQKDTHHEFRDNLWQGILSVTFILSDKNIVTGGHLGWEEVSGDLTWV